MTVDDKQTMNIEIVKCVVGEFYRDVITAKSLYMYLDTQLSYELWVKQEVLIKNQDLDHFEIEAESGLILVFSIDAAKIILFDQNSESAQVALNLLLSYEQKQKTYKYENAMLSDHERYDVVTNFAKSMGCEDSPVVVPIESLSAVVNTLNISKMQIERIWNRLEKLDLSDVERVID